MSDVVVAGRRVPRLPRLPHWHRPHVGRRTVAAVAAIVVLFVVAVATIPPLRRAVALGVSKIVLAAASPFAPSVAGFDELPQGTTVKAADGSVLAELDGAQRREPVKLDAVPEHVKHAVLAAEDANFHDHAGVDPNAVIRALVRNAQGGKQGGSTITQQLAKLNYTGSERTWFRKLREAQYAVRLEKKYSKDELLERYLNQVYFGDGAYGIAAAAKTFFGVGPEQLTPTQAATLAGKIRAPEALDPRAKPDEVVERRNHVLGRMKKHGWLDDAQHQQATSEPLMLAPEQPVDQSTPAPHFVEYVKREAAGLDELGGSPEARGKELFTGGYTIETTLDPKAYEGARQAVQKQLSGPADPATAVVTVRPGDGAITVLFGGLSFDRKFDVASQGRRQPGSAFKPFVYLAAVRDGIDPRSTLDGTAPKTLEYRGERYTVHNYADGQGRGAMTIDEAMVKSINTVFAQLILEVNPRNVVSTAQAAGIPDVNADPAIALGGLKKGVSPLQMAAAYATFAAKGLYAEPYAIRRILDRDGNVVYSRSPKTRQAFDPKEAGVLNAVLQQVVQRGTATAAGIGRPMAGKTGTTQNHHDAWFVGYVPQLATAVWVGHPDGQVPMEDVHGIRVSGGSFPARIFGEYMRVAVATVPIQQLHTARPEDLSLRPLGSISGVDTLPTSSTSSTSSSTTSSTTSSSTSTTVEGSPTTTTSTTAAPSTTTTTTTKPKQNQASTTTTSTSTSSTTTTTATASGDD
ncbi:MAG TPA: transglycosylase domain-containing protein [Acidimicrobiales bacterium]|nr:transglycosylase domain-containing protein [Acidimicrobiales bacterium]